MSVLKDNDRTEETRTQDILRLLFFYQLAGSPGRLCLSPSDSFAWKRGLFGNTLNLPVTYFGSEENRMKVWQRLLALKEELGYPLLEAPAEAPCFGFTVLHLCVLSGCDSHYLEKTLQECPKVKLELKVFHRDIKYITSACATNKTALQLALEEWNMWRIGECPLSKSKPNFLIIDQLGFASRQRKVETLLRCGASFDNFTPVKGWMESDMNENKTWAIHLREVPSILETFVQECFYEMRMLKKLFKKIYSNPELEQLQVDYVWSASALFSVQRQIEQTKNSNRFQS